MKQDRSNRPSPGPSFSCEAPSSCSENFRAIILQSKREERLSSIIHILHSTSSYPHFWKQHVRSATDPSSEWSASCAKDSTTPRLVTRKRRFPARCARCFRRSGRASAPMLPQLMHTFSWDVFYFGQTRSGKRRRLSSWLALHTALGAPRAVWSTGFALSVARGGLLGTRGHKWAPVAWRGPRGYRSPVRIRLRRGYTPSSRLDEIAELTSHGTVQF